MLYAVTPVRLFAAPHESEMVPAPGPAEAVRLVGALGPTGKSAEASGTRRASAIIIVGTKLLMISARRAGHGWQRLSADEQSGYGPCALPRATVVPRDLPRVVVVARSRPLGAPFSSPGSARDLVEPK